MPERVVLRISGVKEFIGEMKSIHGTPDVVGGRGGRFSSLMKKLLRTQERALAGNNGLS
jgi:hypothetical protein